MGLGVCLFVCSFRCCHRRVVIFNGIFQVWGDEVLTFLDGALGPSTFSGRVGKRMDVGGLVGGKTRAVNWEGLEHVERNI